MRYIFRSHFLLYAIYFDCQYKSEVFFANFTLRGDNMIYETIKELCYKKGITVAQAEKEMGYARSTLCKIDKNKPTLNKLQTIADYFGVSVEYLTTGKNSSNIKVIDENENIVVLDDEALELIDSLRKNPEMRMLFSVSKKATKEDIIKAVKIIEALRDENESD